jgi:hypothetical protein
MRLSSEWQRAQASTAWSFPRVLLVTFALFSAALVVVAQTKAPPPDVIIFTNGDQLTGVLERGVGNSIVFKSDMAGEITVSLEKVKELHSSGSFAVLRKDVPIKSVSAARTVTPGRVTYADEKLTVMPPSAAAEVVVPEGQISYIIDQATYTKETSGKSGIFDGWNGALSGGATLVRSTDYGETFNAGIALVRTMPGVLFLPESNRTSFDLQETYGKLTSPVVPQTNPPTAAAVTKTSIFHTDAERDEYFSPRFFALAQTAFDHNYSQGLKLQQIYGAGIGYTVIRNANQELNVKATIQYEKQSFQVTSSNDNLIGSTISETYRRSLPRKFTLSEFGNFIPSFNISSAYSANASATLGVPVYKRLSFGVTATDNYLNNPSPGFGKNSFQFITAISYSLK